MKNPALMSVARVVAACATALLMAGSVGRAAETLPPPAMYPAGTWQGKSVAVVRVLNRLDSAVGTVRVPVGGTTRYESLQIGVARCLASAPTLRTDAAAWMDVQDTRAEGPTFHGWMMEAEPALGVFESPLYDIRVMGCEGDDVAPLLPQLEHPPAPPMPGTRPEGEAGAPSSTPGTEGTVAPPAPPQPSTGDSSSSGVDQTPR